MAMNNGSSEVTSAKEQVAERKAALAISLRQVERTGESWARRLTRELGPALALVALAAGLAAAAAIATAITKRAEARRGWQPPQRSRTSQAARALMYGALRAVLRRAARFALTRWSETLSDAGHSPAGPG